MGENDCRKHEQRSTVEAQTNGRLARDPNKVKVVGWALAERVPKTAPKAAIFCHPFIGTETYAVSHAKRIPENQCLSHKLFHMTRRVRYGIALSNTTTALRNFLICIWDPYPLVFHILLGNGSEKESVLHFATDELERISSMSSLF
jgi:hypothetical protein